METLLTIAQAGGEGQGGGLFGFLLPFILILAIFYFLILRPQSKKQKQRQKMLDAVEKGDDIVTIGGVHGKIVGFKNDNKTIVIKVDDKVNLTIDRTAVSNVKGKGQEST